MNQKTKQMFLDTISGDRVIEGLRKKYLTLSDLSLGHANSAADFCLENKEKIPQRFITKISNYHLKHLALDILTSDKGSAYKQLLQEFVRRIGLNMAIEPSDVKAPLSPEIADALSHLVINAPDDYTYAQWRNKREFFPPKAWKNILSIRHSNFKQHKAKRYSCLLEEGIMKNDYFIIRRARKEPSEISLQEWNAWKDVWFQAAPKVKALILQTPFFSRLPLDNQRNLLADISPVLCDFSFIQKTLGQNYQISRLPLEKLPQEVTYNLVLLGMRYDNPTIIYPPYSHQELVQYLTPLMIAYPQKVVPMLHAYKILEVIREQQQKEKQKSSSSSYDLVHDPDVYFAVNIIKKPHWQYILSPETNSDLWKIYCHIISSFTEAQKNAALSAFASFSSKCLADAYVLETK